MRIHQEGSRLLNPYSVVGPPAMVFCPSFKLVLGILSLCHPLGKGGSSDGMVRRRIGMSYEKPALCTPTVKTPKGEKWKETQPLPPSGPSLMAVFENDFFTYIWMPFNAQRKGRKLI